MEKTRASSKGQMIIPRAVRQALNIRPGTELEVDLIDQRSFAVRVAPALPHKEQIARLYGSLKRPDRKPSTIEEMDAAVLRAVRKDDERIRRYARGKRS